MNMITLEAGPLVGLLFAITRVSGFVVASPLFPRSIPMIGRMAVILTLGFFLAEPVPVSGDLAALINGAVINAAIGITLGFLTGLIFHLFAVAGGLMDFSSGVSTGAIFDPSIGESASTFQRMFTQTGLVLFYVLGGLRLVVQGMALSVDVIALDGAIAPDGSLANIAVELVARLVSVGLEIALPALAALFLIEVVFGIASRFAPEANVFMLGLPAKMLAAFATVGVVILIFPDAMDGVMATVTDTFREGIAGLAAPPAPGS